ncbi:MAG: hypothetical protein H0T60_17895 [Acidobacteria bacterium]|nr:hypothetical protein [Acidobacteriota bacterium]
MTGILLSLALAVLPATGQCDEARLKRTVSKAKVVMIAEVAEIDAPPRLMAWSGLMAVTQRVKYKVRTVLKGELPEGDVWVSFYLVHHSLTADKDSPQVSPELFKENNVHVVFLELDKKPSSGETDATAARSYVAIDENCGAILATPTAEKKIRRLALTP